MRRALPVLTLLTAAALAAPAFAGESTLPIPAQALRMIDGINAGLAASGSPLRLSEVWFFSLGQGVQPFRRLRMDFRWPQRTVGYILDASDYTADVPAPLVDAALTSAYDTWNAVSGARIDTVRLPDGGGNYDVFDAMDLDSAGHCVNVLDFTSPNLIFDPATGAMQIHPEAPIVVGGWLDAAYFADCWGSPGTIGLTFVCAVPDGDHDGYDDIVYVEQVFNQRFRWTTTGSVYLDRSAPFDIESIAVHEDGHALGLDHFGGPNANEPLRLQPNGSVFDPEAIMNPAYLGGEKRILFGPDEAALRTLYGRRN